MAELRAIFPGLRLGVRATSSRPYAKDLNAPSTAQLLSPCGWGIVTPQGLGRIGDERDPITMQRKAVRYVRKKVGV